MTGVAFASSDADEISAIAHLTESLNQQFAGGSIVTGEAADLALKESTAAQTRLQNWFEQAEKTCHNNFFVNSCLNDVKQERRKHIVVLQRISLEAKSLQRKLHIEELDRELAQKQTKP
ncbi:hypothetical protein [Undibacterium sp. TJN19]|uniref:hypothetical protein n=1 Tax=Undibacterium sp. TJN19 TaxID=3413055 RepID=UPI003BF45B94